MGGQLLLLIVVSASLVCGGNSAQFTVKNNCPYTIYPATLTGTGGPAPTTGFQLSPQASKTFTIPAPWSGRLWARTQCSSSSSSAFTCLTGNCGSGQVSCNGNGGAPPVTLAEYTLGGSKGQDYFDISLVDGFNLPMKISPNEGCPSATCSANINSACPSQFAVKGPSGATIACKSACAEYNQAKYCCTGAYSSAATCKPTQYSEFFKNQCPQAFSYADDYDGTTFTCPTGANYVITFCP